MLEKKELAETLGLSCVEKYFSAWLGGFTDLAKLYGNSFVSVEQVFDDFSYGATYQNYCYLPRLQDTAEEYGITEHEYIPCSAAQAMEILRSAPQDALCLVRVNTAFFTGFKRSSWREDHYVCVNRDLKWINEYPLSEGNFTNERFVEVYDGAVSVYRIADIGAEPEDFATGLILSQSGASIRPPRSLANAEDATGILRITRKRLEKFYFAKENVRAVLRDEIKLLDKIYFGVRLLRIKKEKGEKFDADGAYTELCKSMQEVAEFEKRVAEELKK